MKSIKIRLELNNKQRSYAAQHCGVARHAWNWALNLCKEIDIQNKDLEKADKLKYPSSIDLHKLLVKDVKSVHSWYYEVSKCAPQQALRNLHLGYNKFFSELKNGTIEKKKAAYIKQQKAKGQPINYNVLNDIGKPNFKKKGQKDSFYLEGSFQVKGKYIKVPKFGLLKCSEVLPECEVKNVVISRTANDWFIAFKIPYTPEKTVKKFGKVGVDLGIKTLATLSTGVTFENKRPYKAAKRRLKIAQRQVSKKFVKGAESQSNNYKKAAMKVAKIHQKVSDIRKNAIHQLTSYLCKNHTEIVIEDLNIKGMSKNRRLSSAILDGGFYEFRRQCEYKSEWYGSKLTIANRFFPSSKTCNVCKEVKATLKLSERIFKCNACGHSEDRDFNAAQNLEDYNGGESIVNACGVSNKQNSLAIADTVKQEGNSKKALVQVCLSFP